MGQPEEDPGEGQSQADAIPAPTDRPVQWYLQSTHWAVVFSRDLVTGMAIVGVIAALVFAASGVWPPLVAVESDSMEPNIQKGDLVLVVDTDRYVGPGATDDGIVPQAEGAETGYNTFNKPGNVIVFQPDGGAGTPIIHRATLHVQEGEDWTDRANISYLGGVTDCTAVPDCPAPYDGYVTKGDNNAGYDIVQGQSGMVRSEWIIGKAAFRVPYLGYIRLAFEPSETEDENPLAPIESVIG